MFEIKKTLDLTGKIIVKVNEQFYQVEIPVGDEKIVIMLPIKYVESNPRAFVELTAQQKQAYLKLHNSYGINTIN